MAEQIRVSADGTHFLVTSEGPPSLVELTQTLSRLSELRLEHGIDRVLVDSRARVSQPSLSDLYRGGELLAKSLGSGMRIAVLVAHVEANHTLFEDVAINRGAVVAFFQQEHMALKWHSEMEKWA